MEISFRIIAAALAISLTLLPASANAGGAKRPVVVELYTSQGSSSCPPADALLGQLAAQRDILALSLPTTYWDMLGWKDTLASEGNTHRQKQYASAMGRGGIYTPQMIIDGVTDVVGNKEPDVRGAISAREGDMLSVPLTLSATPTLLHVWIGGGAKASDGEATVWLFHILSKSTVTIGDGENKGRTLTYRNIVRDIRPVGVWKGQPLSLDLPRKELTHAQHDAVAIVVQQGGYGRVIGAAMLARPNYLYAR